MNNSWNHRKPSAVAIVEPQAALVRYLRVAHRRFETIVLARNPDKCRSRERYFNASLGLPLHSDIDRIIECDTGSVDDMYQALYPLRDTIAGVVAGDDLFVPMAAALGRRLNFDYAGPADTLAQRVKSAMKLRFREAGVSTPRFFVADSKDAALKAWETLGRDCMLKMVDFQASVNIFRVRSTEELAIAWDTIMHNRANLKLPTPQAREVILEEFVTGRELTVEGYVQGERIVCLNFCEKVTENFVVVGHLVPAYVTPNESQILCRTAEQCVRALGIRNSVFHVEIHLDGDQPRVIECASRPPGAHSVELMNRAYGFDLIDISISLATGEPVTQAAVGPRKYFAMLALYSQRAGILERIEGLDELKQRGGVTLVHLGVKPGDRVQPVAGTHQEGLVILEGPSPEAVLEKVQWLRQNVRLVLADENKVAV